MRLRKIANTYLEYVFVQIAQCICLNCQMYLSKLQKKEYGYENTEDFPHLLGMCVCQHCTMYLSKLSNVFNKIATTKKEARYEINLD